MNDIFIFGAQYLFLFIPVFAFVYFLNQKPENRKKIFLLAVFALPAVFIMGKVAAFFYYDTRPFLANHFTPAIPSATDNGFPSDHTLLSAAIASVISFFSRKLGILLWALTGFVGISRVYVGVHSPQDILGSIIIAAFFTWLMSKFTRCYFFTKTS